MLHEAWAVWGQMLLLTAVLSLDAWAAGVAYGLRRIRVPVLSLLLMSSICGAVFGGANRIGYLLVWALGASAGHWLGGLLLIGRGVWMGLQSHPDSPAATEPSPAPAACAHTAPAATVRSWLRVEMKLRSVGLVVQVLRYPDVADLDRSGGIGGWEALLLGFALALDSVGVGMAATWQHQAWWLSPALVASGAALALSVGGWWGRRLARRWWGRTTASSRTREEPSRWLILAQQWLPAVVLIGLGLARLLA